MVVQMLGRKLTALPITLLALNTLAHLACAIVMYSLWWHKPQGVNESTVIKLDQTTAALLSSRTMRMEWLRTDVNLSRDHKFHHLLQLYKDTRPADDEETAKWERLTPDNAAS